MDKKLEELINKHKAKDDVYAKKEQAFQTEVRKVRLRLGLLPLESLPTEIWDYLQKKHGLLDGSTPPPVEVKPVETQPIIQTKRWRLW